MCCHARLWRGRLYTRESARLVGPTEMIESREVPRHSAHFARFMATAPQLKDSRGVGWQKTHSEPTAVRKWHSTVTSRERALTRERRRKKKEAERNTDNSYPWTNPLDLKTRPWLMPPNPQLTAARRRKGEFDFSRAGSLSAPCCGRRSENSSVDVFLAASRKRESCARGGGREGKHEREGQVSVLLQKT